MKSGSVTRCRIWAAMILSLVLSHTPAKSQSLFEDAYRQAERTPIPQDSSAVGSGFFISPTAVLTSAHVLAGCRSVTVENRNLISYATIREKDRSRDAAILSTEQPSPSFVSLSPGPGQGALQIVGYPAARPGRGGPARYGATSQPNSSSRVTILSAARVPAGMSGAPVVDSRGQAVAVLTGRLNSGGQDTIASPIVNLPPTIMRYAAPTLTGYSRGVSSSVVKVRCR